MKTTVRIIEIIGVIASVAFVAALFLNEPADPEPVGGGGGQGNDPTTETATIDAASLYSRSCGGCHGGDGGGSVGPQLGGGAAIANFPDPADQARLIAEGRNGMPGFDSRFSPEEIDAIVDYSRQLPG